MTQVNPRGVAADPDEIGINPTTTAPLARIVETRLSRRRMLGGLSGLAFAAAVPATTRSALAVGVSTLTFTEIAHGPQKDHAVSPGYTARVLIRWGDPVVPGAPAFAPLAQTAQAQARQFGTNCDFQAFMPLPVGSGSSDHGLLWLNHEYPQSNMMFPGLGGKGAAEKVTSEQVDIEIQSIGGSVVEIRKTGRDWAVVMGAANRRITADTPMRVGGPASGHVRMRTGADPAGTLVRGTVGNCGGGVTPWGTILTAEENFDQYFMGELANPAEAANYRRLGVRAAASYGWGRFHDRFNLSKEPNEPNRFGWIVEVDPYDPLATPVKRTALGRFKHEAAETTLTPDGRVVVYSGDDARNEYLFRFVSRDRFNPNDRAANRDLLDHGVLSVARFLDDGAVIWEPLIFGTGPLTPANGFNDQGDVVIEARRAADLLKATPMDRPEDVETNPVNGNVYVVLTNNSQRKVVDKANPRAANRVGHILELVPPRVDGKVDHAADRFGWDIFLLAGNPGDASHQARYGGALSPSGWLACPDNVAFDKRGRMWIASDQGEAQPIFGIGDGIWACDVEGPGRAVTRMFYRVPTGAEMCGPAFTPDCRTLFVAVQHPAGDDPGSSFDTPSTRWPDFQDAMPPRSSVVVISHDAGHEIGT
jgi:secreted PhoX family phosphatase